MPSFDIVNEIDIQKLDNAINVAKKEIVNRYDFHGSKTEIDLDKKEMQLKIVTEDQMRTVVGATCPSLLFPYARQVIDSLMVQGTLPPLMLPPINFDSLFQQALAQQAQGVHAPLSH